MSILKKKYKEEIRPLLQKKLGCNVMQVPILEKIVISMGIADVTKEKAAIEEHQRELAMISGQKPILVRSRKNISNFHLKVGQPIGLKVTLRGERMYDFLYRFCNLAAPRIRDFRGFDAKGDGRGNFNIGLEDQQAFYEVDLDKVKRAQGMNIAFVTTAKNDAEMKELLCMLGFPFK